MKIYKAAIIGLGPSGLAVNKLIYGKKEDEVIAFENTNFKNRNNLFGFWLTDWMKPFEKLIKKKWHSWSIGNDFIKINHYEKNYPYCVISFDTWREYCLDNPNKIEIKIEKVLRYYPVKNYFKIITEDKREYFAEKIYDSRSIKHKNNELIQHFFGINITTEDNKFHENEATLMHFTQEESMLHFIYALPFSHNKALIESTVFSKEILTENWYRNKIDKFLKNLNITKYEENEIERGVIPMFSAEEKSANHPNIFNIGIRGGACKTSTGYAFSFLIKQILLLKKTNKNKVYVHNFIDTEMDKIFIKYLKNFNENGKSFINLAKNLNGYEFQSFMMGQSSLLTKIKIINSMPKMPFIMSIFKN